MSRRVAQSMLVTIAALLSAACVRSEDGATPLPTGALHRLGVTTFRTGSEISGVAVLPGSKHIAAMEKTGLSIWDLQSGAKVAFAAYPEAKRRALDFRTSFPRGSTSDQPLIASSDGKLLVALRAGKALQYTLPFGTATPVEMPTITSEAQSARRIVFGPNGMLYGINGAGRLVVWDGRWSLRSGLSTVAGDRIYLAAGGDLVVLAGEDSRVRLWNGKDRKEQESIKSIENLWGLAISADGKVLATLDGGPSRRDETVFRGVQIWDTATRKELGRWKCHELARSMRFSPDGSKLALLNLIGGEIQVYESLTGKRLHTLKAPGDTLKSFDWSLDGKLICSGGQNGTIHLWNAESGKPSHPVIGHSGAVTKVCLTPSGDAITAGDDNRAILWSSDGHQVRAFEGHTAKITGMALDSDGKNFFTVSHDGTLRSWDITNGKEAQKLVVDPSSIRLSDEEMAYGFSLHSLAISRDGKTLAVGCQASIGATSVRIIDVKSFKVTSTLRGGELWNPVVHFAGNNRLVSLDVSGHVRLWDLATNKELAKLDTNFRSENPPTAMASDGRTMAFFQAIPGERVAQWKYYLAIWDPTKDANQEAIDIDVNVSSMAFSPDAKRIALGSNDGKVRVIDMASRKVGHQFEGHQGPVLALAFSPDGKQLISGGRDAISYRWSIERP